MRIFISLISVLCMGLLCSVQCQQQVSNSDNPMQASPSDSQFVPAPHTHPTTDDTQARLKYAPQSNGSKKALYKKLHKLVDELMREDRPVERKLEKQLLDSDQQDKLFLVMMKKRPTEADEQQEELAAERRHQQRKSNTLDLLLGGGQGKGSPDGASAQDEQQVLSRNLNSVEHARRILDDRFGIMKESKFTTNNHLGLKGVPKFGSDDEY